MRAYNDSKSTTPGATVRAVRAFDDADRIHLIVGGYDKGSDLSPIIELAPGLAGFYTIGTTGPRLAEAVPGARACGDLAGAVETARDLMGDGDILLLSPGCASWDQFDDFEARGRAFIELVRG